MSKTQSPGEFGIKNERVNDVLTNRARDGIPPECGEVSAEPVPHLLAADHRAHREPVTQALDSIDM